MPLSLPLPISTSTQHTASLEERLERFPDLKDRIESLLSVAENTTGDLTRADDAEQIIREEIRKLGQETLQTWATTQQQHQADEFKKANPTAHRSRKKNSTGTVNSEP